MTLEDGPFDNEELERSLDSTTAGVECPAKLHQRYMETSFDLGGVNSLQLFLVLMIIKLGSHCTFEYEQLCFLLQFSLEFLLKYLIVIRE